MTEIYVKITALCKRVAHFPPTCFNPSEIVLKPHYDVVQNGGDQNRETLLRYTIVFQFPNEDAYEQEQMSACLSHCVPLFQSMVPQGWFYDDQDDEYDMWVDGIIQESEAKGIGYVPFQKYI